MPNHYHHKNHTDFIVNLNQRMPKSYLQNTIISKRYKVAQNTRKMQEKALKQFNLLTVAALSLYMVIKEPDAINARYLKVVP